MTIASRPMGGPPVADQQRVTTEKKAPDTRQIVAKADQAATPELR